jgi:hypothetical protein
VDFLGLSLGLSVVALLAASPVQAQTAAGPAPATAAPSVKANPQASSTAVATLKPGGAFASDTTRNIAAIAQAISTLINIGLVVWIFVQNSKIREKERNDDAAERRAKLRLETSSFWIQKLIMEPASGMLHDFFNHWRLAVIDSPLPVPAADPGAAARMEIEEFNKALRLVRDRVEEPLVLIDQRFSEIGLILNDLQDVVTLHIQKRHLGIDAEDSRERAEDAYRRVRRAFFAKIYEIHRSTTS